MAVDKDDAVNTLEAQAAEKKPTMKGPGPIKRFMREVMVELKKTNWPTKNELTKSTFVVVTTIVVVAVLLFVYDVVAAELMKVVGILR